MERHEYWLQAQARMTECLRDMLSAWHRWPAGTLGRLAYFDKVELRRLGEDMVRYGQAFIAEADRQEAEKEKAA